MAFVKQKREETKKQGNQFGTINKKRFDAMDKRFDAVDSQFSTIDKRFSEVNKRFNEVDQRFNKVDKRLDVIDNRLSTVDKRFKTLEETLRVEIKITAEEVTKKLETTVIGVKDILLSAVNAYAKEVEENREDRIVAAHQTAELRKQVDDHEKRILQLEKTQAA